MYTVHSEVLRQIGAYTRTSTLTKFGCQKERWYRSHPHVRGTSATTPGAVFYRPGWREERFVAEGHEPEPRRCRPGRAKLSRLQPTRPETYLRLSCERLLEPPVPAIPPRDELSPYHEAAAVARALMAARLLDEGTAKSVFDDYGLALCVRGRGLTARRERDRRGLTAEKVDLSASRAMLGEYLVGHEGTGLVLHKAVFGDDATYLELSWSSGQSATPLPSTNTAPPGSVMVADDQGTTASAPPVNPNHSQGWWRAEFVTDKPLSPTTAWLEVDGERVVLPAPGPRPEVRTEAVPALAEPLMALLYRELTSTLSQRVVVAALAALVATGSLSADSPVVAEVDRVAARGCQPAGG